MRILMLTQYFPPESGAAQVRLKEVAKGLQRSGHQVTVVTAFPNHPSGVIPPNYRGHWRMKDEVDGIPVWRTWIYPVQRGRFWKRLLNYFSFVFSSFWGLSKVGKQDILFFESPPLFLGITALIYGWLTRTRIIMNISDLWPESAVALGLVNSRWMIKAAEGLEKLLYRKAWKISTQTEGIRDSLLQRGVPKEKVTFLPNGVNLELFAPRERDAEMARTLGIKEDDFVLIYAGTMGYAQGLESVIHTAVLLKDKPNVRFLFVGDGTEKPMLEALVQEKGLANVIFVDFQPVQEMPRYFSLSSASIVPLKKNKLFEGARPSKMFPALGSAVPVIYSGEGEAAELVLSSGGGVVVAPENSQELAQAILELQKNPNRREMGQKGRRFVEANYTWSEIIRNWLRELGI
ncbi:glycosyltransferase family 4 protein [Desulfosporosinus sp.]|uniref:glycosyltransferase family 4 protein n=1 Tax=Desulfosporosinus sp. TaxID=157907 RepID=UPI0025C444BA|nr:glycosyltransferase family 4 protein [Desulfosporosinus sp.]MBC2721496.1 glycosyltransferase family 4 protein [Desulfosporosinus sp.]MBC2726371.1 glycosyltransferase family 4 protein [Desulfosporosinus sp.]